MKKSACYIVHSHDMHTPHKMHQSFSLTKFWNEIPAVVKETQSINTFKGNLKKYLLDIQTTSMLDHVSGR